MRCSVRGGIIEAAAISTTCGSTGVRPVRAIASFGLVLAHAMQDSSAKHLPNRYSRRQGVDLQEMLRMRFFW